MMDASHRLRLTLERTAGFRLDVDLALPAHGITALFGASGSGKTTLLRCVNMLEEFHQGRILIDGEEIGYSGPQHKARKESEIARQRAMTGMVFQQFNLFPHMTALRNVTLGLTKVKKLPAAEANAIADLERTFIAHAMQSADGRVADAGQGAGVGL